MYIQKPPKKAPLLPGAIQFDLIATGPGPAGPLPPVSPVQIAPRRAWLQDSPVNTNTLNGLIAANVARSETAELGAQVQRQPVPGELTAINAPYPITASTNTSIVNSGALVSGGDQKVTAQVTTGEQIRSLQKQIEALQQQLKGMSEAVNGLLNATPHVAGM
jgi:hypothetical protein